jgi:hypothetical protein
MPTSDSSAAKALLLTMRGPEGTRVRVEGLDGEIVLGPSASNVTEPRTGSVRFPLPAGWYERLDGRELVVRVTAPAGPERAGSVRFEGATLALDES